MAEFKGFGGFNVATMGRVFVVINPIPPLKRRLSPFAIDDPSSDAEDDEEIGEWRGWEIGKFMQESVKSMKMRKFQTQFTSFEW